MFNPLLRPDRFLHYLAQAKDGTMLYTKIDRDDDLLFSVPLYRGKENLLRVVSTGFVPTTDGQTLVSRNEDEHVRITLDCPFMPAPEDKSLNAWLNRLSHRMQSPRIGSQHFNRLDPDQYDIVEGDQTVRITHK